MLGWLMVLAVSGAVTTDECQWPSVVTYRVGDTKCTGTFVHPRAFVTAAHCLELSAPGRVRLGEDFSPYARRFDVEGCAVQEAYWDTQSPGDDYAICTLVEPLDGIPIVPIATGCDVEALVPGAPAAIVGFGLPEEGGEFGLKRYGLTEIADKPLPDGYLAVGDDMIDGCLGDSGGPGFVQLPDGTWRVFGILTVSPPCGGGPSTYTAIHPRVAWMEAQTGLDLTPCHDADGGFTPGPECAGFDADPLDGDGRDWSALCGTAKTFAPTTECPEGVSPPEQSDTDGSASSDGSSSDGSSSDPDPDAATTPSHSACTLGAPAGMPVLLILFALARRPSRQRVSPRGRATPSSWTSGRNH